MNFLEFAKQRTSVRSFEETKVEQEKCDRILEAARIAPTTANRQAYHILAMQSPESLKSLTYAGNTFDAPLVYVVFADTKNVWRRKIDGFTTKDIDTSIITTYMMLEATSLGLGSVWICNFDPETIMNAFKVPEGYEPINILAVGYSAQGEPDIDRYDKDRKDFEENVSYEYF